MICDTTQQARVACLTKLLEAEEVVHARHGLAGGRLRLYCGVTSVLSAEVVANSPALV